MSLKVFDLECAHGHVFEGWFSAEASFGQQQAAGEVQCPVCGDDRIVRKLSAPRLSLPTARREHEARQALAGLQAQALRKMRELVRQTEDVGTGFAREAMRMHHGEIEERAIRGKASAQEQQELADAGVAVVPLPAFLDDEQLQ